MTRGGIYCIHIRMKGGIPCIRIRMRGGIYGKIWPEVERNPEGSGHVFSIYPDLSPATDIIQFLTMIY